MKTAFDFAERFHNFLSENEIHVSRSYFGDTRSTRVRESIVWCKKEEKKEVAKKIASLLEQFTEGKVKVIKYTVNLWNNYAARNRLCGTKNGEEAYFINLHVAGTKNWWRELAD